MPRGEFEARLERLISEVKNAPPIDANKPVLLPGEAELDRARQRKKEGIPVDVETVDRLSVLAEELGVTFSLTEELA